MKSAFNLFYKNLFLCNRLFICLVCAALLFILSFFFTWLGIVPAIFFWLLISVLAFDIILLYKISKGIFSKRLAPERLSNGDENEISIHVENLYPFTTHIGVIDEIPHQFQKRDVWFQTSLKPYEKKLLNYKLRPTKRGEYEFGALHIYSKSPIGLISRRYKFSEAQVLPVYPSFLQMRRYELMAISNRLSELGIKKVRRLGNNTEFEQIKNYVPGDDYRTLNWKATARQGNMMVNSYTDEKSQHVYCVIDKSRVMKMPFDGLSLLDYAINASLVLSSVALIKEDKAGLITMAETQGAVVPAERRPTQLNKIMEVLYKEKTRYLETNVELLYTTIRNTLKQRSLIVYFTNFETVTSLQRQLPFLKRIAKFHLLLVVVFENTELKKLSEQKATNVEGIYINTIAEKFTYEKKLIVKELNRCGIQTILTSPQSLTISTVNRYLELKAQQKI